MCISVALVSLGTALLGIGVRISAQFSAWAGMHETSFGLLIVAVMLVSFLIGVLGTASKTTFGDDVEASPAASIGR